MEKKGYISNFEKLGFGLFVHFGIYSILGRGEWIKTLGNIEEEKYNSLINKFNPHKDWAKRLVKTAKDTGCKYITITTRHHDGFSLFDTKGLSNFDSMHALCHRDLIREFVDACNSAGIVPFFYHTLIDWNNKDYANNFDKYIDYLVKSVEILCTNYGKIGGFWFDGMWDKPNENWQEDRLYGTIRKYQKDAMIINNTGLSALGEVGHYEIDSVTFERGAPCFVKNDDKYRAGEMCQILNDHWGYAKNDCNYKSVKELIENLVDSRRYDCNMLLNTGLMGNGLVKPIDKYILMEVGKWVKTNKNFIYNIHSTPYQCENGIIVSDDKNYYVIIKDVFMNADPNVAKNGGIKEVVLPDEIKCKKLMWLDNGKKHKIENGKFTVDPFAYGNSFSVRVAKLLD